MLIGRIYHIVNDDMYIDLGLKFPCVCKRPRWNRADFARGTEVRVLLKSTEMSQTFLAFDKEMTLMEAEGVLLGLHEGSGEWRWPKRRLGRAWRKNIDAKEEQTSSEQ